MNSTCRLCGETSRVLKPVFSFVDGDRLLVDSIHTVCPIRIAMDDKLPKKICGECLEIVTTAMRLRETSIKTDIKFRLKENAAEKDVLTESMRFKQEPETHYAVTDVFADDEPMRDDDSESGSDSEFMINSRKRKKNTERVDCPYKCGASFSGPANIVSHLESKHRGVKKKRKELPEGSDDETMNSQPTEAMLRKRDRLRAEKNPLYLHFTSTGRWNEVRCNYCSELLCKTPGARVSSFVCRRHLRRHHPEFEGTEGIEADDTAE